MASSREQREVPDMCFTLNEKFGNVPWNVIEFIILNNSSVWRPMRGHCFETWFVRLLEMVCIRADYAGGDSMTDLVMSVDGREVALQLKTPSAALVKEGIQIGYDLHKTHGRERMPDNLYDVAAFPDFLVGQHPNGVLICSRDELPRHPAYPGKLKNTVVFRWDEKTNDFESLGIRSEVRFPDFSWNNKEFPIIGRHTKLSDYDILKTMMREENFRLLNQNLMGNIREWHFIQLALSENILLKKAEGGRDIKIDFTLTDGRTIQVKGATKRISKPDRPCIEVKGSHGRIPQRLYKKGSFSFLAVVLDPFEIPEEYLPTGMERKSFNCVIFPEDKLPLHMRSGEWDAPRYKDIFCFQFEDVDVGSLDLLKPCLVNLTRLDA